MRALGSENAKQPTALLRGKKKEKGWEKKKKKKKKKKKTTTTTTKSPLPQGVKEFNDKKAIDSAIITYAPRGDIL